METPPTLPVVEGEQYLRFETMLDTGVLWLINSAVFHPRGFALAIGMTDDGEALGWTISGDGSEPWSMPAEASERRFAAVEAFLDSFRPMTPDVPK